MHYFYQVKERPDIGVYVKDLSAYVMNNADDMDRTMTLGNKNRKYHLTLFRLSYLSQVLKSERIWFEESYQCTLFEVFSSAKLTDCFTLSFS